MSPNRNDDLAAIHGQKYLCGCFEIQIEGCETLGEPRLRVDLRRQAHTLMAGYLNVVPTVEQKYPIHYGLGSCPTLPWSRGNPAPLGKGLQSTDLL